MSKRAGPEMIDDENPEWTNEDLARAVRVDQLPEEVQRILSKNDQGDGESQTSHELDS